MTYTQTHIDFTQVLHQRENNPQSEQHLKRNIYHFTGQCAVVLSLLEKGEVLTTGKALVQYGIGDLRARIRDLRNSGVPIKDKWFIDEDGKTTRFKEYYL